MDDPARMLPCTLSTKELDERRAEWGAVEAALIHSVRTDSGLQMRFLGSPGIGETLRALISAERHCCGWASWALSETEEYLQLDVTGPADDIDLLARELGV